MPRGSGRWLGAYPVAIDLLIALVFVSIMRQPWRRLNLDPALLTFLNSSSERQLGAAAIRDEVMAGVTVVSILFVALAASLGLPAKAGALEEVSRQHLRAATLLCVSSLVLGVWILGTLPTQVNFYNVAYDQWIALFSVAQVALTLLAGWRIANGLWIVLR